MQLGVDFDGTVYRYRVCRKLDGRDAMVYEETENLEAAQKELKSIMKIDEKVKRDGRMRYWIMKETSHYERVFDTEPNE